MDFRKKWILGNWKMNGSLSHNQSLLEDLINIKTTDAQIGIAAPFVYLPQVSNTLKNSDIAIGVQDISQFDDYGAYTGEISATMLHDFNTQFVLIGHSERRQYFNEENTVLLKKFNNALNQNILPVLCIGETLAQREAQQEYTVIEQQLALLKQFSNIPLVVAYEPIWAIGTGKVADSTQITQMHHHIHQILLSFTTKNDSIRILYGGSVNADNAKNILQIEYVDGALVGGASLNSDHFGKIIYSV